MKSFTDFFARILGVLWRKHLTNHIHHLYFDQMKFYKLISVGKSELFFNVLIFFHVKIIFQHPRYFFFVAGENKIDNPDQRMASDIQILCTSYSSIIIKTFVCPVLVIYYGYDAYQRSNWVGPTGILGMFIVSALINRLLMGPVVRATVHLEKMEGCFRFAHAHIRYNW